MNKRTIWASGLVAGSAGTIALISTLGMAAANNTSTAADVLDGMEPTLTALTEGQSVKELLPETLLGLPVADHFASDATAREVGVFGRDTYYLIEGADKTVCLISIGPNYGTGDVPQSSGTCAPLATVTTAGIYGITDDGSGSYTVAVVAPDGITTVSAGEATQKVSNNVAVFHTSDPSELRLTNDSLGATAIIDTGELAPTQFQPADQ